MKKPTNQPTTPSVVLTPAAPVAAGGFTLGLDLGDRSHYVCALDAAGQIQLILLHTVGRQLGCRKRFRFQRNTQAGSLRHYIAAAASPAAQCSPAPARQATPARAQAGVRGTFSATGSKWLAASAGVAGTIAKMELDSA
jgi:hypothetical protein